MPHDPPLDIDERPNFQRRSWVVERVGWLSMASILLAGILGLFGNGIFGPSMVTTEDERLSLQYERFWRQRAPMSLRLDLRPRSGERSVRVRFDASYLEALRIAEVSPRPSTVQAAGSAYVYEFLLSEPLGPLAVTIEAEPKRWGALTGSVGLEDGARLEFEQFIYP